jgi:hypothetical protein
MKYRQIGLVVTVALWGSVFAAGTRFYDGAWWVEQGRARKVGFIAGAEDCLTWEHDPPVHLRYSTIFEARERLDDFYGNESRRSVLVVRAMGTIQGHERATNVIPPGAQHYPEPHGYYDGMWWSDLGDEDRGFVEGYISCLPDGLRLYPKDIDHYVQKVDGWYQSGPLDRDQHKIADVLAKFRENRATPIGNKRDQYGVPRGKTRGETKETKGTVPFNPPLTHAIRPNSRSSFRRIRWAVGLHPPHVGSADALAQLVAAGAECGEKVCVGRVADYVRYFVRVGLQIE